MLQEGVPRIEVPLFIKYKSGNSVPKASPHFFNHVENSKPQRIITFFNKRFNFLQNFTLVVGDRILLPRSRRQSEWGSQVVCGRFKLSAAAKLIQTSRWRIFDLIFRIRRCLFDYDSDIKVSLRHSAKIFFSKTWNDQAWLFPQNLVLALVHLEISEVNFAEALLLNPLNGLRMQR